MLSTTKKRILRLIERAGYVVTKVADHERREQLIDAELTRRAERVAELENLQAALATELNQQRDRALQAERKLFETDHTFRLGHERHARELETARAEIWEFRALAAELRQQLKAVQQERCEYNDLLNDNQATAAEQPVDAIAQERSDDRGSTLNKSCSA